MGATGAGKTTLLDVLAGRKTHGRIEGRIRFFTRNESERGEGGGGGSGRRGGGGGGGGGSSSNGGGSDGGGAQHPAPVPAYAEQEDEHFPRSTVAEALAFSNNLRCGAVAVGTRATFVDALLELLELGPLRERAVGSLSRGELKRVTVGVELASNPSVLFLDEPTTGLDAREAAALVRVLRNVSETGRNVIATIHQPSAEVFFACTLDLPAHRPNHPPTHPSS